MPAEPCCCCALAFGAFVTLIAVLGTYAEFSMLPARTKKTLLAIVATFLLVGLVVFVIFRWIDFFDTYF